MGPLAAFLLATPVFGFSLQLDPSYLAHAQSAPLAVQAADVDLALTGDVLADTDDAAPQSSMADEIARRRRIGRVHRAMGIAT